MWYASAPVGAAGDSAAVTASVTADADRVARGACGMHSRTVCVRTDSTEGKGGGAAQIAGGIPPACSVFLQRIDTNIPLSNRIPCGNARKVSVFNITLAVKSALTVLYSHCSLCQLLG